MDVFVSYSRRDVDFTRIVVQKLKDAGHEVWVDWEDIPYSSDWWKEITRGMDSCQAVVVVVTPDSLRSDVCNKEITYARGSNKRMIPVLHRDIPEPEMMDYWAEQKWGKDAKLNWDSVRAHNWLFCRTDQEYQPAFVSLLDTIARDPENAHYHTRLLVRAREWQNSDMPSKGRDEGLLLRGEDLRQAENWLQFNRAQEPRPTPLHSIYIGASASLRTQEIARATVQSNRLRRLVLGLSVLLVFALISGGYAVNRSDFAERSAMTAIEAESRSNNAVATAEANLLEAWEAQALYRADRSQGEMEQGHPQGALLLALESLENFNQGIYNTNSQVALTRAVISDVQETAYFPHDSVVNLAVWSADRQRVATIAAFTISVWSTTDSSLIARLNHSSTSFVRGVMFSADGERLLSWDSDGVIRLWHITSDEPPIVMRHLSGTLVNSAQFSPDETKILTASDDKTAVLWDAVTGAALSVFQHADNVNGASFSLDGLHVLTWSRDKTVRVWNISGDIAISEAVLTHDASVRGAVFSRDQSRILTWTRGQNAYLWLLISPDQPLFTYVHGDQVNSATFNRNETLVLTASADSSSNLWSSVNGNLMLTIPHDSGVDSAVFSGDERRIVTVTSGRDVRVWNISDPNTPEVLIEDAAIQRAIPNSTVTRILTWSGETAKLWILDDDPIHALEMHQDGDVYGAIWDENARRVLTWGEDGTARLWRVGPSGEPRTFLEGKHIVGAILDPQRKRLASWETTAITVRSVVNALEQPAVFQHANTIEGAAWSSDGKHLATWTDGGTQVWVWSVESPNDAPLQLIHTRRISGAVWSKDSTMLVTWDIGGFSNLGANGGSTVTVWTLTTPEDSPNQGAQRLVLPHSTAVSGVLVNPAGDVLATWGGSQAYLWSMTGLPKLTLTHDGTITGVLFNASGEQVLTWGVDSHARLWDTKTGDLLLDLVHDGVVSGARFSRSGQQILTWSIDSTARIWSVGTGAQLAQLNHHVTLQGQIFPLEVADARWNTDETYVLTLALDGQARVWRLDGSGTAVILRHPGLLIREALWSDDGRRILTWDETDSARVWEVDKNYRMVILRQPSGLRGASWTTDPKRVLTWAQDGARVWTVDISGLITIGEALKVRELSNSERAQLILPTYTPSATLNIPTMTPMPTLTPKPAFSG